MVLRPGKLGQQGRGSTRRMAGSRSIRVERMCKIDWRQSNHSNGHTYSSNETRTQRVSAHPIRGSPEVIKVSEITSVEGTNAGNCFVPFPDYTNER